MGLFKPAWMSEKEAKALRAVKKENEPSRLTRIALEAPLETVRVAAVNKLPESWLTAVAQSAHQSLALIAVERLTTQRMLADVVKETRHSSVQLAALEKISDQDELFRIASSLADGELLHTVVRKMTDCELLATLIVQKANYKMPAIFDLVSDQQVFLHVFQILSEKRTKYGAGRAPHELRKAALGKITDQALLMTIITDQSLNDFYREYAVALIDDPEQIRQLSQDTSPKIRCAAVKKLDARDALLDIAKTDGNENVVKEALVKIHDPKALQDVVLCREESALVFYALSRITSVPHIRQIYEQVTDPEVKSSAEKRLQGFICEKCGQENNESNPKYTTICVCAKCRQENHSFRHISNVKECKKYEYGGTWDECVRCGRMKNYKSVDRYTNW